MKILQFGIATVSLVTVFMTAYSAEFPQAFVTPSAQELILHLSGNTVQGTFADGTAVQSKYASDGTLTATAPGFYDMGRWKAEDGKICGSLRKLGDFCNDGPARFRHPVSQAHRRRNSALRDQMKNFPEAMDGMYASIASVPVQFASFSAPTAVDMATMRSNSHSIVTY